MRLPQKCLVAVVGVIAVVSCASPKNTSIHITPTPTTTEPMTTTISAHTDAYEIHTAITRTRTAIFMKAYHDGVRRNALLALRARVVLWDQRSAAVSARPSRVTTSLAPTGPVVTNATGSVNGNPCGGLLPSCCTLRIESGGDPTAQNPVSSSSGLWQFTTDTWGDFDGYPEAKDAPVAVQNERAVQVFAGGAGWAAWRGDGCYPGG